MIIFNPSKTLVSIVIKGVGYKIESEGYTEVIDSVGAEWMKIHQFLQGVDEMPAKIEVKAVAMATPVEKEGIVVPVEKVEVKKEFKAKKK